MATFNLFSFFKTKKVICWQLWTDSPILTKFSFGLINLHFQNIQICIYHRHFGRSRYCLLVCPNLCFRIQPVRCCDYLGMSHLQKQLQRVHRAEWSIWKTRTWLLKEHLMHSELITWATRPNAFLVPRQKSQGSGKKYEKWKSITKEILWTVKLCWEAWILEVWHRNLLLLPILFLELYCKDFYSK